MVFGQTLVFDRTAQKGDTVLAGSPPGAQPVAAGDAGKSSPTSHQCMQKLPGAVC